MVNQEIKWDVTLGDGTIWAPGQKVYSFWGEERDTTNYKVGNFGDENEDILVFVNPHGGYGECLSYFSSRENAKNNLLLHIDKRIEFLKSGAKELRNSKNEDYHEECLNLGLIKYL